MSRFASTAIITALFAVTALGEPPRLTSLSDDAVRYTVPEKPYVVMNQQGIRAVIVNNEAVDDEVLPGHRAGYSGVASLTGAGRKDNLFVPAYAGLNFEHIHDGTTQPRDVLFEPRRAPMELRRVNDHRVELYQRPTPTWGLESCTRYEMLDDGTIEMTFECIPRRKTFRNGYIGLFWASYIHQPESLDIHFRGHSPEEDEEKTRWIRGVTPRHGVESTHLAHFDRRTFRHDEDFPLTLVFNRSKWRYREPWYFGVNGSTALVLMFRDQDQIRFSQSPSGGGKGNPAWDFQCFIEDYRIDQRYQLIMRAKLVKYESLEQVAHVTRAHREALQKK